MVNFDRAIGQAGQVFTPLGKAETEFINAATKATTNLSKNFSGGGGLRSERLKGILQDVFRPVETLAELKQEKKAVLEFIEKSQKTESKIDDKRLKLFNQLRELGEYTSEPAKKLAARLDKLLKTNNNLFDSWWSVRKTVDHLEAKIRPLQQLFDAREVEIAKLTKQADEARQLHDFEAFNELEQQIENLRNQNASL
ncbi:MAG: hypothetical protein NTW61_08790 [Candidatus Melainabacteria bacterium]|nr:hypothetical protein [Candidatus Melainabacteria bacterium]